MLATLLAIRTSWIGIFVILAGIALLWLIVRAAIDFATWFKEEIIDDFRQRKEKRKGPRNSED